MRYRPLGDSGLVVSVVGVGCNAFGSRVDEDGVREMRDMLDRLARRALEQEVERYDARCGGEEQRVARVHERDGKPTAG